MVQSGDQNINVTTPSSGEELTVAIKAAGGALIKGLRNSEKVFTVLFNAILLQILF